jgi:hypothetical protein
MHTYRPGNLRDEIPKEGGFDPPRAVTPRKNKKKKTGIYGVITKVVKRYASYIKETALRDH